MARLVPAALTKAIHSGVWRDPGPDALRELLGSDLDLSDLSLAETEARMHSIAEDLDSGGYVDDPEFCMIHGDRAPVDESDPRLDFDRALFVAASIVPGDDVFVALDLRKGSEDPDILVFDWRHMAPWRWVRVGKLTDLIRGLARFVP